MSLLLLTVLQWLIRSLAVLNAAAQAQLIL